MSPATVCDRRKTLAVTSKAILKQKAAQMPRILTPALLDDRRLVRLNLEVGRPLPQFSDRLNANAPSGLAPAAKPLRVSLADYAAGGQYV